MKFRNFSLFSVLVFLLLCSFNVESNTKLNKFVDPYIGTGGHGHSFLGVTTPFGTPVDPEVKRT